MGLIALRETLELTNKCAYVVRCELFLGLHTVDLKMYKKMPEPIKSLHENFRKKYPFVDEDRPLTDELEYAKELVMM